MNCLRIHAVSLIAGLSLLAAAAHAHERPVVKVTAVIHSPSLAGRFHSDPGIQQRRLADAQLLIAQSIANELNQTFGFVQWVPVGGPPAGPAGLRVTLVEDVATRTYYLTYERHVTGDKKIAGPVDWGKGDALFTTGEDTVANGKWLGPKIAAKVAVQMGGPKRAHVMSAFLARIPLCTNRPEAKPGVFTVHLDLEAMRAAEVSALEISFKSKVKVKRKETEASGWVRLRPLRTCDSCENPTNAYFGVGDFPEIGPLTRPAWDPAIPSLFDETRKYKSSVVYMFDYWSIDSSQPPQPAPLDLR